MATIRVPRPAKESFKKDRRISDLVSKQVEHLQHVEAKLPPEKRSQLGFDKITTEADAAQYIAYMTSILLNERTEQRSQLSVIPRRQPDSGISIAAAATKGTRKPKIKSTQKTR